MGHAGQAEKSGFVIYLSICHDIDDVFKAIYVNISASLIILVENYTYVPVLLFDSKWSTFNLHTHLSSGAKKKNTKKSNDL